MLVSSYVVSPHCSHFQTWPARIYASTTVGSLPMPVIRELSGVRKGLVRSFSQNELNVKG